MLLSPFPPDEVASWFGNPQLHIPDGFLSLPVALVFWGFTIVLLYVAARRTEGELGERQIPLMGIMAAFIFAGQMINFPIAGGTSGHLLGGALAAIILGPWAGILVMASVVALQGLLFQDGGLVVMGANIFNMGLLTVLIGYGLYRGAAGRRREIRLAAGGMAAWVSVMAAAFVTALQLWLSGTSTLQLVLPAILGVHALIGLGEALITVAALRFIIQTRPDLLEAGQVKARGGRGWIAAAAAVTLGLLFLAPFASANPDGLERVAANLGFLGQGSGWAYTILPGYTIPLLGQTGLSTVAAGAIGALAVGIVTVVIGRLLRRSTADAAKTS